MNSLLKTISQVKLSYFLHEFCLLGDLTMNMLSRVFPRVTDESSFQHHLLSKTIILTQWALSLGILPSVTDSIFKTIFRVTQLYRLSELCLLGELTMNVQSRFFSMVANKWPIQNYLLSTLSYWLNKLLLLGDALLMADLTLNVQFSVFPSVTNKQPFQDHLPSKPAVLAQWALSPGRCSISWETWTKNMQSSLP